MKASHSQLIQFPAESRSVTDDNLSQVEEQLLVMRTQQHDHEAFQELLSIYERRVLYYVHRLTGDLEAALDVAQDVWVTVYQRIDSLRAPAAFRVWLFRIAHHKATTARRGQRRVEVQEELAAEDFETESWDELSRFGDAERVHQTLDAISVAHREVLALRFLEDLQLNEIAEVVGCHVATAKTRLHYAKKAFRKKFAEIQQPKGLP